MGLRFRKSIKIAKGLRLNLSGSGVSMSVGGRGATVNFSSRGTRTTVGIPGTGISWTSTSRATDGGARAIQRQAREVERARKERERELAALERERRALEAQEAVAEAEAEVQSLVRWWRHTVVAPPALDAYRNALLPRRFETSGTVPQRPTAPSPPMPPQVAAPNLHSERTALEEESAEVIRQELSSRPLPLAPLLGGIVAGLCVGASIGFVAMIEVGPIVGLALVGAAVGVGVGHAVRARGRVSLARRLAVARTNDMWPERARDMEQRHRHAVAVAEEEYRANVERVERETKRVLDEHERLTQRARHEWEASERSRIHYLRRLVEGDIDTVEASLDHALSDLDFPFEAAVDFGLADDGRCLQVVLDLPEIEDTIPEQKLRALKNGQVREGRRPKPERNLQYAELAIGLGVAVGTVALLVAPSLDGVVVAGYTQRRRRGKGHVEDHFVYELVLSREEAEGLDGESLDPIAFAIANPGRIDVGNSMELRAIEPPSWISSVRDA